MMFGITVGFGLLVIAAGLGLAGVIQAEPRAQVVLRYAGALYLLYLAWRIAHAEASNGASRHTEPIGFLQALLLQGINPKGWAFAFGALAAYTTVGGNVLRETAIIAAINATTCFISVVVWSGFGTLIGRFLRSPRARTAFNWTMAGLLVLSLIPIFW
jgi:threonine/homoserine/homoserine lactone efflux protein